MARPRDVPGDTPEEDPGVEATVAVGGLLPLTVKVAEGVTVNDEAGVHRGEGDEFTLDALTAVALAQQGQVTITGTGEHEIDDPEERAAANRAAGIDAEIAELEARVEELKAAK